MLIRSLNIIDTKFISTSCKLDSSSPLKEMLHTITTLINDTKLLGFVWFAENDF